MAQQPLFGYSPEQIMQARQAAMQERAAAEASRVGGGWAPLYEQARGLSMMGAEALGRGLFPQAQDPALQRAQVTQSIVQKYKGQDFNSPSMLSQMASEFSQAGIPEVAMELSDRAKKLTPTESFLTVAPGASVINRRGEVVYTAPKEDKESVVKTPANFAAAAQELGLGVKPNLADYTQAEAEKVNNLLQVRGERTQAAGVPQPGQVKIPDIKGAQDIVNNYTKAPQERLSTVNQLRVSLGQVKQGTGAALPQLRRDLVKLVGDNQIGQNEVQQALGSIGIVGDSISGINQLFTGVPSAEKIRDVEKFITALEKNHVESYNKSRQTANNVLSEAKLSPQTVKTLIPPEAKLKTPSAAKPGTSQDKKEMPKFENNKVYRDAEGNRARYVVDKNGKGSWVPL
jgi:hypothetical protein